MMEAFSVETMSILMLAVLNFVMMFGHPIAFVFGGVGLIFGYLLRGPAVMYMFTSQAMGTMDSRILVAVVMCILMANLLVKSGIAEQLFEAIRWLMGPLRRQCVLFAERTTTMGPRRCPRTECPPIMPRLTLADSAG